MTAGGPSIVSDYAWGKHSRFVDIGGAYGSFLAKLLTSNAGTTGVLFDQPQVSCSAPCLSLIGEWLGSYKPMLYGQQHVCG